MALATNKLASILQSLNTAPHSPSLSLNVMFVLRRFICILPLVAIAVGLWVTVPDFIETLKSQLSRYRLSVPTKLNMPFSILLASILQSLKVILLLPLEFISVDETFIVVQGPMPSIIIFLPLSDKGPLIV